MCDAWLIWALRLIRAGAAISWPALLFRWFPCSFAEFYSSHFTFMHFGTALPGRVLAKCSWPSIAVPFIEEAFFRGIVLGVLLRTGRKYMAIFAVSAIFAAVHFLKAPERTSEIVTWTSGFSSIAHAFDGIGDPTMVALALATLFFIGWILADARVLTHSLWLSIGLHAGWIFGSGAFSRLARQQTLAFPWIGKNMLVGIIPLGLAVLTWIIMRTWFKYDRASQV